MRCFRVKKGIDFGGHDPSRLTNFVGSVVLMYFLGSSIFLGSTGSIIFGSHNRTDLPTSLVVVLMFFFGEFDFFGLDRLDNFWGAITELTYQLCWLRCSSIFLGEMFFRLALLDGYSTYNGLLALLVILGDSGRIKALKICDFFDLLLSLALAQPEISGWTLAQNNKSSPQSGKLLFL